MKNKKNQNMGRGGEAGQTSAALAAPTENPTIPDPDPFLLLLLQQVWA